MWMLLTPREVELVMRPVAGIGENARVLRDVQQQLDPITGEADLSDAALARVESAAQWWQGGHEQAFKAILAAVARHR